MNKRLHGIIAVLAIAVMLLTACGTASAAPEACKTDAFGCAVIKPGQTIKIGMGAPMTGDNAAFGQDISQGAKIAMTDAGQFQGFSFELVAQDDGGTAEGGAAVANKFVSDPTIVAIEGHIFSGATKAAIPIYEKAGLPMMSPSATNPDLTKQGSKVFNRLVFTDAFQGKSAAEYLFNTLKVTKLAVMHDGQAYGQGLAQVVNDTFTELGGSVVAFQAITPGESDYSAVLADIASKKPEAIFFGGYTAEAVVVVNQMKQSGLEGVIFFGDDGTFGQDFLDRTGANGEGAYATSLIPAASDAKLKFDEAYKTAYGTDPASSPRTPGLPTTPAPRWSRPSRTWPSSAAMGTCTSRAVRWLLPCAASRITRAFPAWSAAMPPASAPRPARTSTS